MSSIKFFLRSLYLSVLVLIGLATSTVVSAQNLCESHLSFSTDRNNEPVYYLNLYYGPLNFRKLKPAEIKAMLERVEVSLANSPNDENLLNVYWYTVELLDYKNRSLEIRKRRFDLLSRLDSLNVMSKETMLYRYYVVYRDLKDYEQAFRFIFMLTRDFPENLAYSIERIRTNLKLHEFNRASSLAESKLKEYPENINLLRLGAEAFVRFARTITPNTSENRIYKASLYAKADLYFKKLLEQIPLSVRLQAYYVNSLLGQKTKDKFEEALNYLNYSGTTISKFEVMFYKAWAYLGLRQLDDAEPLIRELVETFPKNRRYSWLDVWYTKLTNELNNFDDVTDGSLLDSEIDGFFDESESDDY